jgi:hypothetical protein
MSLGVVEILINNGSDVNCKTIESKTPLIAKDRQHEYHLPQRHSEEPNTSYYLVCLDQPHCPTAMSLF